ncbi:hypothetical protein L207DRAFT_513244, partial [Hyaloscypha variabilis F]
MGYKVAFSFRYRSDLVIIEGDQNAKRGGVIAKVYLKVLAEYLPIILEYDSILKAEIDRAYPKLKGIGNSQAIIDFMI